MAVAKFSENFILSRPFYSSSSNFMVAGLRKRCHQPDKSARVFESNSFRPNSACLKVARRRLFSGYKTCAPVIKMPLTQRLLAPGRVWLESGARPIPMASPFLSARRSNAERHPHAHVRWISPARDLVAASWRVFFTQNTQRGAGRATSALAPCSSLDKRLSARFMLDRRCHYPLMMKPVVHEQPRSGLLDGSDRSTVPTAQKAEHRSPRPNRQWLALTATIVQRHLQTTKITMERRCKRHTGPITLRTAYFPFVERD